MVGGGHRESVIERGRTRKGEEGGERAREGRGKWGRHVFQVPHKQRGKGKRARERGKDEAVAGKETGEPGKWGDGMARIAAGAAPL